MIPKIKFEYSPDMDARQRRSTFFYQLWGSGTCSPEYLSPRDVRGILPQMKDAWEKSGYKLLADVPSATGLLWKSQKIYVYAVGGGRSYSTNPEYARVPVKFAIKKDMEHGVDELFHELIHRNFVDNPLESKPSFDKMRSYSPIFDT